MKPLKDQARINQAYGRMLESKQVLAASLFSSILLTATAGIASTPVTGVSSTVEAQRPKAALNTTMIARSPGIQLSEGLVLEPWVASELKKSAVSASASQLAQATPVAGVQVVAQASPENAEAIRKRLLIEQLVIEGRRQVTGGASSAGTPTAFGSSFGDAYIGATFISGTGARGGDSDGAMSMGFGLGDARQYAGLEVNYNLQSIRRFAANGSFDFKLHRVLTENGDLAAAVGWESPIYYGSESGGVNSSVYGVVTKIFELQPDDASNRLPLTVSVGLGGGRFRSAGDVTRGSNGVNFFTSAGLQVAPPVSLIANWTGQSLNLGTSYIPNFQIPLSITATVANVAGNAGGDARFLLSVGYGFNFGR